MIRCTHDTCMMLTAYINTTTNTVRWLMQPVTDFLNLYMLSCAHRQVHIYSECHMELSIHVTTYTMPLSGSLWR